MYLEIYLIIGAYFFLYNTSHFASVEALVGDNVRSARENEFPFIVAIAKYYRQDEMIINYFCGGSLISKNAVLSSEHCLEGEELNGIQILVGSSYLDSALRYYPSWWVSYTQWAISNDQRINYANDIAILHLTSNVQNSIVPFHIWYSSIETIYGVEAQIAGWGRLQNNSVPNTLQVGTVTILQQETCEQRIMHLSRRFVRAEPMNICSISNPYVLLRPGDSGGPLFYNNLLIGINFGTSPFHGSQIYPDQVNVHEHISYYYDFISDMKNNV